jgi:hypothetical protein
MSERRLNPKLHAALDDFGMAYGMEATESRRTTADLISVIREMLIEMGHRCEIHGCAAKRTREAIADRVLYDGGNDE